MGYPVLHGGEGTGLFVLEADLERGREWVALQDRAFPLCQFALGWLSLVPGAPTSSERPERTAGPEFVLAYRRPRPAGA
jgi:hypothetical protein